MIKTGAKPTGGKSPSVNGSAAAYISTKFTTKKNSSKTPVGPNEQDFQTFGQTIETKPKEEEFDVE